MRKRKKRQVGERELERKGETERTLRETYEDQRNEKLGCILVLQDHRVFKFSRNKKAFFTL
jgi:hypothetical protein